MPGVEKGILKGLLVLLALLLLTSCSEQDTVQRDSSFQKDVSSMALKIYVCRDVRGDYIKEACEEFNKNSDNISIEVTDFGEDFIAYCNKTSTELMVGEGPDIITMNTSTFSSIHKAVSSGAFYGLDVLFEKDKDINLSDYNEKVLESGVFNGKRYLVPLDYNINVLTTTEEKLDRDNFTIPDTGKFDWEEISGIVDLYILKNKEKYFFEWMNPIVFFQTSGLDFVDAQNKTMGFTSPEFIKLLELYKKVYNASIPEKLIKQKDYDYNFMDSSSLVFIDNNFMNKGTAALYGTEKRKIYPIEMSGMEGKVTAFPYALAGINPRCGDKKAAFEYIKLLISEKMQKSPKLQSVPVNNAAFRYGRQEGNEYDELAVKLSENIGRCEIFEGGVYTIMKQEIEDFMNGRKTSKEAAGNIQDRVGIYLNE